MSVVTFRERWQLFAGAVLTVSVGVALVQASMLSLVAAVAPTHPAGLSATQVQALNDRLASAASLLGMILGISVFVAIFVVGSTFSFTVAQRSRDFALLRLVGAGRRQVRRLLLGEAVLLGTIGTLLGVGLGLPVALLMAKMLIEMDFVPAGFEAGWRPWILGVSAATGIGVAVIGSLSASRRASRVRPLDAVQNTGRADKVMTVGRLVIGVVALAGAAALMVIASSRRGDPLSTALPGLILAIIAMSSLAPLAVPAVGRTLGLVTRVAFPRSPIRELVNANVRDGVRRSASTAAPVVVLVGLVVGFSGAMNLVSNGAQEEGIRLLDGDLIVTSAEPSGEQLADLEGVLTVSEEVPLLVRVESDDTVSRFEVNAIAVSSPAYLQTHQMGDAVGSFTDLQGRSIALDESFASSLHVNVGDTVRLRLDGTEQEMRVVAIVPYTLSGYPVLLPLDLALDVGLQRRYIVQADEAETAARLRDRIRRSVSSRSSNAQPSTMSVLLLDEWIQDELDNQQELTRNVILAVLGLVTLYVVIAMVNVVVIAGAPRSAEFAKARLTGLSRKQVILMALWESLTIVIVGVALGLIAAGATIVSTSVAVSAIVGKSIIEVPWHLLSATTVGALIVVGVSSVLTTLAGTRQPPISVAGAKE